MSNHRSNVLENCHPPLEVPFSREEYRDRLAKIRARMASDKIGRRASLFTMLLLQGIVMLLFYKMGFSWPLFYLGSLING